MDRLIARSDLAVYLVSIPPIVVVVGWLGLLAISAITGRHPIWNLEPRNLPEAFALRDGGAVIRMVERGEDVNRAADVRAGLILDEPATLTPIEAAAGARQSDLVQLVFDLGASVDAATWQRAWCISDATEVREVLDAHRPSAASRVCEKN